MVFSSAMERGLRPLSIMMPRHVKRGLSVMVMQGRAQWPAASFSRDCLRVCAA